MRIFSVFSILFTLSLPTFAQPAPPPATLHDLAPTGKLRAAINYGHGVRTMIGLFESENFLMESVRERMR